MICSICGSQNVEWKGPMISLTHTECADCGGTNCQEVELDEDPYLDPDSESGKQIQSALPFYQTKGGNNA